MLAAAVFLGTCHSGAISSQPIAIDAVKSQSAGQPPADTIGPAISVAIQTADNPVARVAPSAFHAEAAGAICQRTSQPGMPTETGFISDGQLGNASLIMAAAAQLGLPRDAQILGIQAALGESSLEVKAFGDVAGPDSRGLFQQRDNGAWGLFADRMDPYASATSFFMALKNIDNWELLPSSLAIHRVQRNQDPDHYVKFRQLAHDTVDFLGTPDMQGPAFPDVCTGNGWRPSTTGTDAPHNERPGPARGN